jgi:zinc protease
VSSFPSPLSWEDIDVQVTLYCEQSRLDNGLRIFAHEDRTLPLIAINLWYHVGSRNERPGRTGFAHLFEHLMFEGSAHVPKGRFDQVLEGVGGVNNGSTSTDRTNYWETVPAHALELALYLESDRMGWLAPSVSQARLDAQRDVVKNERRQSYENRPYGLAWEKLRALLYPAGHPYQWPVIGSMADLDAATLQDVLDFLRTYYAPNNATLAIAGAVDAALAFDLADRWFGGIPRGPEVAPPSAPAPALVSSPRRFFEDAVQLPRIYFAWHSPATFAMGDAELDLAAHVLAHGRASRLYRALVHDREIAQDVDAYQRSAQLGSVFCITATARPGVSLFVLEEAVRQELERLARDGIASGELERARNVVLTSFVDGLQTVGGFGGKADRFNLYAFLTGDPNHAEQDFARYENATESAVVDAVRTGLANANAVVLGVIPQGRRDLSIAQAEEVER